MIQDEQGCVTEAIQAVNLESSVRELARARYVAAVVTFKLRDTATEDFGVLTEHGTHKSSFGALEKAFSSPLGTERRVTLGLHAASGHIVASGSAPVGDYMALEAFKAGVLRYTALFTLDRFNRYSITLPGVLGTKGLRVRVYQYWMGSSSAAQRSV